MLHTYTYHFFDIKIYWDWYYTIVRSDMTSPNRRQLACFGSLNRKPIYTGNVQQAVDGRIIPLIKDWPSGGFGVFNTHSLTLPVNA